MAKSKRKYERSKDKLRNKDGSLSMYAFACGYIEVSNGVTLFKDGCWHVRWWRDGSRHWESFDLYREARNCFRDTVKEMKNNINKDEKR